VKSTETTRRSALRSGSAGPAGPDAGVTGAAPAKAWPQFEQNRASARFGVPQVGQAASSGEPQLSQNRLPGRFSVPHAAQRIGASVDVHAEGTAPRNG
jgi:hypothetical protein